MYMYADTDTNANGISAKIYAPFPLVVTGEA